MTTETAAEGAPQGSPFWQFSLAIYRDAEVARACLNLQDDCAVDVNLLLYLLWLACARRAVTVDALRALDRTLSPWRAEVVTPLRAIRRRLKREAPLVDGAQARAFRTRIKALELESERLQQEAMFAVSDTLATGTAASPEAAARASLKAYQDMSGRAFNQESVEILIRALPDR